MYMYIYINYIIVIITQPLRHDVPVVEILGPFWVDALAQLGLNKNDEFEHAMYRHARAARK